MLPELAHTCSKDVDLSTDGLTKVILSYKHDVIHRKNEVPEVVKNCRAFLIEKGIPDPNFEQIFQLVLELYHSKVKTVPSLDYSLPECFGDIDADLCNTTLYYILNSIYIEVSKVHNQKPPRWAQIFLKDIIKGFDYTDLFTLNYDTLLDGILTDYNDGFCEEGDVKEDWVTPYRTFNEA